MHLFKILFVFIFFILCFPLSSNEREALQSGPHKVLTAVNFSGNLKGFDSLQSGSYGLSEFNFYSYSLYVSRTGGRQGPVLSVRRKAAIAMITIGLIFFVTGIVFLATSLGYSYYINQPGNSKNYAEYIKDQNISRGLFYGSMATLGTGALCIVISIPLFVEPKRRR